MWWRRGGDRVRPARVVDDEVGVRADRDRALAAGTSRTACAGAVEMTSTQRSRRDAAADDAAVVEQVDPVLDARQPVGDLAEVAPPELLLAVEVERAVVGRDDLEVVLEEARPQLAPGASLARSGGEHTNLAPSKPLPMSSSERNRYWGHVSANAIAPAVPRVADRLERVACRQVDDVDRHAGGLRQADDPVGRLALEDRVADDAVVVRIGLAVGDRLSAATTSMARPFSACIMIRPPFLAVCCIARKIAPSSL